MSLSEEQRLREYKTMLKKKNINNIKEVCGFKDNSGQFHETEQAARVANLRQGIAYAVQEFKYEIIYQIGTPISKGKEMYPFRDTHHFDLVQTPKGAFHVEIGAMRSLGVLHNAFKNRPQVLIDYIVNLQELKEMTTTPVENKVINEETGFKTIFSKIKKLFK